MARIISIWYSMVSQVDDVSFASCFDRWFEYHEMTAATEIREFVDAKIAGNRNTRAPLIRALLLCMSVGSMNVNFEFFDHRHMFVVPGRYRNLAAAFIASPYLPTDRLAISSRAGYGVCFSGIANSAAAKLLRTTLRAGLLVPILCYLHGLLWFLLWIDVLVAIDSCIVDRESIVGVSIRLERAQLSTRDIGASSQEYCLVVDCIARAGRPQGRQGQIL
jgi:hypothetical protein